MTLLLSKREVEGLLDLPKAIELTEATFREQAEGTAVTKAPSHIELPNGGIRMVSGALGIDGGRIVVRTNLLGSPTPGGGIAMLFDDEKAELAAVMAYPFGVLRTAAVFAVTTDRLADPAANELAMIGMGRNAIGLMRAACAVRPIERIRVYGRDPERLAAYVAEASEALGLPVTGASTTEEATAGAQVVYVSTSATTPVLMSNAVPNGAFVAAMGTTAELDGSAYLAADRVFVTTKLHEERHLDVWNERAGEEPMRHTLLELDADGTLPWSEVNEFSDVIGGTLPGRRDGETIVLRESQGGYGDAAFASAAFEAAIANGAGTPFSFV
ncbi:MAG TPA: hypothetical protein VFB41_04275 [Solirubrobacteraceae bacterium]|nr:hypothetical protein [Solirubrobacteraceae bacterium]